ncbi:MAG: PAAR domain-containing protein [Schwartzia sp.]|nr:PAAR domain-containing protein [Schwartzia sp. (in: firmicutes)]
MNLASGSPDVNINGRGAGRVGDSYAAHGCPAHPPHTGVIASGSGTVFINGRQAGRIGDPVSCGGNAAVGSGNVFIGG